MKLIRIFMTLFCLVLSFNCLADMNSNILMKEYEPLISESDLYEEGLLDQYIGLDFSLLWLERLNYEYRGFIGKKYRRIRIKLISIIKNKEAPTQYLVKGKSAHEDMIKPFKGTFSIISIRRLSVMRWGLDNEYENSGIKAQGVVFGKYYLEQNDGGSFEGVLSALWYIDKSGDLKYDEIENYADPFRNNQFIGVWREKEEEVAKMCNWGDYRVPASGDLDIGAGEFFPNYKYENNGWNTYIDSYKSRDPSLDDIDWGTNNKGS